MGKLQPFKSTTLLPPIIVHRLSQATSVILRQKASCCTEQLTQQFYCQR